MKSSKKPKPRGVRLNRAQDCRRLLSRLINQAMRGEIDTDLLRGITYSIGMILKSIEVGELSDRLGEIEKRFLI